MTIPAAQPKTRGFSLEIEAATALAVERELQSAEYKMHKRRLEDIQNSAREYIKPEREVPMASRSQKDQKLHSVIHARGLSSPLTRSYTNPFQPHPQSMRPDELHATKHAF
jgi:hypothetical protein